MIARLLACVAGTVLLSLPAGSSFAGMMPPQTIVRFEGTVNFVATPTVFDLARGDTISVTVTFASELTPDARGSLALDQEEVEGCCSLDIVAGSLRLNQFNDFSFGSGQPALLFDGDEIVGLSFFQGRSAFDSDGFFIGGERFGFQEIRTVNEIPVETLAGTLRVVEITQVDEPGSLSILALAGAVFALWLARTRSHATTPHTRLRAV